MSSQEQNDRRARLETLKGRGQTPYPIHCARDHTIAQALANFDEYQQQNTQIAIAGRIRSLRHHGKSFFIDIEDVSGKIQGYAQTEKLGIEQFNQHKETLDEGDIVQAQGTLMATHRGEKTIVIRELRILTKTLRPLPEKWHGLVDTETRLRKRYLDFLSNPSTRKIIELRSMIIRTMRDFYTDEGFLEVETPILQPIPGGANARPFVTHHHSLDQDFYLRIAPELYLKRLLVGGFERVFEIGRNFRNEGIDAQHNPEFTECEAYAAYWDATRMRSHIEELFLRLSDRVLHHQTVEIGEHSISFKPPFEVKTFGALLKEYINLDIEAYATTEALEARVVNDKLLSVFKHASRGSILDDLFKAHVRPHIIQPLFVIDYPYELAPLAKRKEDNPALIDRFQLVIGTHEIVNAFSEGNDPLDQRARFEEQETQRERGDEEAQHVDEDYLEALEHGMPPAAGMGIGVDRLVTLMTGVHSIKETLTFPTLRMKSA